MQWVAYFASAGFPSATPEIMKIEEVEGVAITYERELPGEPLQKWLSHEDRDADPVTADRLVEVLAALATVPATEHIKAVRCWTRSGLCGPTPTLFRTL